MTRYQLSFHAENVPRGLFRKPSTYAVVTVTGGPQEGTKIGRTEEIDKMVNPDWVKTLFLETDASEFLPFKVSIYDDRGVGRDDVLIVEANFEATEVFRNAGHTQSEQVGRAM
jgi:hypothetical protein